MMYFDSLGKVAAQATLDTIVIALANMFGWGMCVCFGRVDRVFAQIAN